MTMTLDFKLRRTKMKTSNKKPSHSIFQVIERPGAESIWNKIGAAWIHQDCKGFNLQFNALPLTGKTVLRLNDPNGKEKGE